MTLDQLIYQMAAANAAEREARKALEAAGDDPPFALRRARDAARYAQSTAARDLVAAVQRVAWGYIYRTLRNDQERADALSETLAAVTTLAHRFSGTSETQARSWVWRIARSKSVNETRAWGKHGDKHGAMDLTGEGDCAGVPSEAREAAVDVDRRRHFPFLVDTCHRQACDLVEAGDPEDLAGEGRKRNMGTSRAQVDRNVQAWKMVKLEGYTGKEVAPAIDLSPSSVAQYARRGGSALEMGRQRGVRPKYDPGLDTIQRMLMHEFRPEAL